MQLMVGSRDLVIMADWSQVMDGEMDVKVKKVNRSQLLNGVGDMLKSDRCEL